MIWEILVFVLTIFLIVIAILTWSHARSLRAKFENSNFVQIAQAISQFKVELKVNGFLSESSILALDQLKIEVDEVKEKYTNTPEIENSIQHLLVDIKILQEKAKSK